VPRNVEVAKALQVRRPDGSDPKVEPPQEKDILAAAEPGFTGEGSVTAAAHPSNAYYKRVSKIPFLRNAWRAVQANGVISKSEETRAQVKEFASRAETALNRIYRKLLHERFSFPPSIGIATKRSGKAPRPIVISPIEGRIVQRSILDVLQLEPELDRYYKNPTSFGGIKGKGVPDAIKAVWAAYKGGASHYIRSDIEGFFTNIRRLSILRKISNVIKDEKFNRLLSHATHSELDNLIELGKHADLFPTYEIGVAQGCCLSPLFGNILLDDFDRQLNERGVVCIRYIDDFIILGSTQAKVRSAFQSGQRLLLELGLTAYDPALSPEKAEIGDIKHGLQFLGCELRPGLVRPTRKSRTRLSDSIRTMFARSSALMGEPVLLARARLSLTETLRNASNVIKGWGNQYSFCNDRELMEELDSKIDELINDYLDRYIKQRDRLEIEEYNQQRRRLMGIHLLIDSKRDPIIS